MTFRKKCDMMKDRMPRKASGGEDRLRLYDTGRGLIPFVLCGAAFFIVRYAIDLVPVSGFAWHGVAGGIQTFFAVLNRNRDILLFCCVSGAGLSLIRKVIRM